MKSNSTILLIFLLGLIAGCQRDYQLALPNGYRLVRTNIYTIAIFPPMSGNHEQFREDVAVPPKIVEYGINKHIVFGRTEFATSSELDYLSTPGYFILDTAAHSVRMGMNEFEWREELRKNGVPSPSMKSP